MLICPVKVVTLLVTLMATEAWASPALREDPYNTALAQLAPAARILGALTPADIEDIKAAFDVCPYREPAIASSGEMEGME